MRRKREKAAGGRDLGGNGGFTLLEISVVVALLGVIMAVSLPGLGKPLAYYRLKVAASQMAQDLREIQQTALNEESDKYRVFFAAGGSHYEVRKAQEQTLPQVIKRVYLPPTVKIVSTTFKDNAVTFSVKGTPYPQGGTVTLQDTVSGRLVYVIVASITGRVRISTSPPESWEVQGGALCLKARTGLPF
ncbi:type II secretion system protein [Thermanaeromonas sp. C210]|uniref:type II secretion system protein n=1 Tax=Thermanaeromonas sp. C210 TaxID=2731925 RepID=UPI00155C26B6|nr:type II secretion system protein [Thermanaeromonas sp. C210]GFN23294.1 prepilin-type N-terminal cleavage/methylation domain-containing protein [Thermanaeromonas sp. C210]